MSFVGRGRSKELSLLGTVADVSFSAYPDKGPKPNRDNDLAVNRTNQTQWRRRQMSTPIIDIRRPGPCGPRAAADAGTASNGRLAVRRELPLRPRSAIGLPQHPDKHRPEILLAVDSNSAKERAFWVSPIGADRVDPIEVREHEDVEQLGAGSGPRASRRWSRPSSISSSVMADSQVSAQPSGLSGHCAVRG